MIDRRPRIGPLSARPESSSELPKYEKPPVVEVAISVQFDELAAFSPVHYGLFWERIRDRYPKTEHHPPLGSIMEVFGTQGVQSALMSIEGSFPLGRCWYLGENGQRLLQLQPNRFALNWRKLDADTAYPSYDTLRQLFQQELEEFLGFASDNGLGEFEPTQCELTYLNHFFAGREWHRKTDLGDVIARWCEPEASGYLPEIEDVRLAWQHRFEEEGVPLGRLHIQLHSAFRTSDRHPLLVLQLIGRGAPIGQGVEGVVGFADEAHAWIVRGFTEITTEKMHTLWERQR